MVFDIDEHTVNRRDTYNGTAGNTVFITFEVDMSDGGILLNTVAWLSVVCKYSEYDVWVGGLGYTLVADAAYDGVCD